MGYNLMFIFNPCLMFTLSCLWWCTSILSTSKWACTIVFYFFDVQCHFLFWFLA